MEVDEGEPGKKVSMDQLFKGKKGVLFAVPGAFTPGCSKVKRQLTLVVLDLHAVIFCPLMISSLVAPDSPPRFCAGSSELKK